MTLHYWAETAGLKHIDWLATNGSKLYVNNSVSVNEVPEYFPKF